MARIKVKIDRSDLAAVDAAMSGIKNGYKKILVRSLNKTITGVRTDAVSKIRKEITPKAKIIRDTFKLDKANYTKMTASVKSTGWPIPLIDYKARAVKRGVTFQVRQAASRSLLPGAFIAIMTSGHKGVFWREYRDTHHAGIIKKKVRYGALPVQYRLPIRQRYGPAVPTIMESEKVMKPILKKAGDRLSKEIDHQLEFEMSKL